MPTSNVDQKKQVINKGDETRSSGLVSFPETGPQPIVKESSEVPKELG